MDKYKLTIETLESLSVTSLLLLEPPVAIASTLFLLTLGSPSALSTACLFVPDVTAPPSRGPKYAASSLGFLRAWGREREPVAIGIGAAADAM